MKKSTGWMAGSLVAVAIGTASTPALAVDGCKVLLCITGNWRSIPLCVPDVKQALRDAAMGKSWPTCSSAGSNGQLTWTTEATCPAFYSSYNPDTGAWASCQYPAMVRVVRDGVWWLDLYTDLMSSTSTHYSDEARQMVGIYLDPTYDHDASSWQASLPPPPPPCSGDNC